MKPCKSWNQPIGCWEWNNDKVVGPQDVGGMTAERGDACHEGKAWRRHTKIPGCVSSLASVDNMSLIRCVHVLRASGCGHVMQWTLSSMKALQRGHLLHPRARRRRMTVPIPKSFANHFVIIIIKYYSAQWLYRRIRCRRATRGPKAPNLLLVPIHHPPILLSLLIISHSPVPRLAIPSPFSS